MFLVIPKVTTTGDLMRTGIYTKKYPILLLVILIVSAVLISGCTEKEPTAPNTQVKELSSLTFGYQPSTHQISYVTAREKGWWNESLSPLGVKKLDDKLFPTGAPEMNAMLAGEIDVAYVGSAPVVTAIASGLDAKIVAAVQINGSDIVLRTDLPYKTPQDLKGLKIATFPPGTIQDTLLRDWLKANGMTPDKDVTIIPMGSGDASAALSSKRVDAVFLPHPAPVPLVMQGIGRTVMQSGSMNKDHACCVVAVSGKLIREYPEIVQQIVATHVRAASYDTANIDEAASIYAKDQAMDIAIVQRSLADWDGSWVADPGIIADSTVEYAKVQYEQGTIKKQLTKDDLFDMSFYNALKK